MACRDREVDTLESMELVAPITSLDVSLDAFF
jgi:hypothetical protein